MKKTEGKMVRERKDENAPNDILKRIGERKVCEVK